MNAWMRDREVMSISNEVMHPDLRQLFLSNVHHVAELGGVAADVARYLSDPNGVWVGEQNLQQVVCFMERLAATLRHQK